MEETRRRLLLVIPLTLLVIAGLLWLHFRDLTEVLIVLLSLPFALVGSVWLMWLLGERLSAASWVGLLALAGLAVQTGVVMIVYIDAAYAHRKAAGLVQGPADVVAAHLEGTVARLRPKLMTVGTMLLGLAPLLWSRGAGAEVMRRVAIPMIGGLATSAVLTLEIIPVVYTAWRTEQLLWERLAPLDPPLLARLRRHAAGLRAALALLAAAGIVALAAPGARAPAAAAGLAASLAAAWAGAASLRTRREAVALVWPAAAPRPGAAESPLAPAPSPEAAP
jgi:Cu(I)/Ag(I) efflux system membrane protein CusA/SilA